MERSKRVATGCNHRMRRYGPKTSILRESWLVPISLFGHASPALHVTGQIDLSFRTIRPITLDRARKTHLAVHLISAPYIRIAGKIKAYTEIGEIDDKTADDRVKYHRNMDSLVRRELSESRCRKRFQFGRLEPPGSTLPIPHLCRSNLFYPMPVHRTQNDVKSKLRYSRQKERELERTLIQRDRANSRGTPANYDAPVSTADGHSLYAEQPPHRQPQMR